MAVRELRGPAGVEEPTSERTGNETDEAISFDALYRRHVQTVYMRLTRLVGPLPEREDLVQEVFVELYRALPGYRGDAPILAFLYGVTARVAYDHLRRRQRKKRRGLFEHDLSQLVAEGSSPERSAHERKQLELAFTRLDALKPKKRIAFVLHVIEGHSLEEMSRMLDIDARTLGQRVAYARRELLAMYERDELRARSKGGHHGT